MSPKVHVAQAARGRLGRRFAVQLAAAPAPTADMWRCGGTLTAVNQPQVQELIAVIQVLAIALAGCRRPARGLDMA